MKIPIKNIYYLLSYSWEKLDYLDPVSIGIDDYDTIPDLFGRVFLNGFNTLLKQGLEKSYLEVSEEYPGVKGKIQFKESLSRNLFQQGRARCEYDEYSVNTFSNQILKRTLFLLKRHKNLNAKLHDKVNLAYFKLSEVDDIEINSSSFNRLVTHKNNRHYNLLLSIAKLIIDNLSINQDVGDSQFIDFLRDEKKMAGLFERFLRNFYKSNLPDYKVTSDQIKWDVGAGESEAIDFLPKMKTDIVLLSKVRKIVIDAKYYKEALSSYYDAKKFHSNNLYQLFTYIKNLAASDKHPLNKVCEGMLIYPTNGYNLNHSFVLNGHKVDIVTVDLSKPWKCIESDLLSFIYKNELI